MPNKRTKLEVIIGGKCPRCQNGNLFESQNSYKYGKMTTMNTHCSNCGLKFDREPGYFFGAMYVSYAMNIAFFVMALIAFYLFFDEKISGLVYMLGYVLITVLLFPIIYRLSRSIWINIMVKYQPNARGEY
jgi:uncharacterized protein (DUF983 family)